MEEVFRNGGNRLMISQIYVRRKDNGGGPPKVSNVNSYRWDEIFKHKCFPSPGSKPRGVI